MQKSKMNAFPNEAMWRDAKNKFLKPVSPIPKHTRATHTHPKEKHPSISKLYYMLPHTQNYSIQTLH